MPITLPNTILNGQSIDAVPVMANFNALASAMPSAARCPWPKVARGTQDGVDGGRCADCDSRQWLDHGLYHRTPL